MGASALHLVPHRLRAQHAGARTKQTAMMVGASRSMTIEQLQDLAASVGFPPDTVATAAAIAMAESSGDPCANGDPHNPADCSNPYDSKSYGLWQIDTTFHSGDKASLTDPTANAQAALAISANGTDFSPWSTYKYPCAGPGASGPPCYEQYLQPYNGAVPSSIGSIALKVLVIAAAAAAAFFGAPTAVHAVQEAI